MLRSGTTLIEQILASHPAIFGAGELTILGDIAKKIEHLINEPANNEDTLLAFRKAGQEYLDRCGNMHRMLAILPTSFPEIIAIWG